MTLTEFIDKYDNYKNDEEITIKKLTEYFNELDIVDRKRFFSHLTDDKRKEFIKIVRRQAVVDFWCHEREAIMNGECTRDWTPEQIESIMNIDKRNGEMCTTSIR